VPKALLPHPISTEWLSTEGSSKRVQCPGFRTWEGSGLLEEQVAAQGLHTMGGQARGTRGAIDASICSWGREEHPQSGERSSQADIHKGEEKWWGSRCVMLCGVGWGGVGGVGQGKGWVGGDAEGWGGEGWGGVGWGGVGWVGVWVGGVP